MGKAKEVLKGRVWRILAVVGANGRCPFQEFFQEELTQRQRTDLWALLMHFADRERIVNEQKFKAVEGTGIFELKEGQIRVFCFTQPDWTMVLTHGAIKKKARLSPQDIDRARRLKAEFEGSLQP
jgi:hypothetical protein